MGYTGSGFPYAVLTTAKQQSLTHYAPGFMSGLALYMFLCMLNVPLLSSKQPKGCPIPKGSKDPNNVVLGRN